MRGKSKPKFEPESKITCFWGTGASGATTFSLEYSRQLADAGRKTLLIDFDLLDPSLMVYFAIDNYPSGLQAGLRLASQERLDPTNIDQLMIQSEDIDNLKIMAGMPASGRFQSIQEGSVSAMLELLRGWFDELVIDLGCVVSEVINNDLYLLQQEVLEISDSTLGVFRADPDGLAKLFWLPIRGNLIANNYRPGSLGAGGKKGLRSVVAEMTGESLVDVAEEDDQLIQAIAKGLPVGALSKKSSVSHVVRGLMQNRLDAAG